MHMWYDTMFLLNFSELWYSKILSQYCILCPVSLLARRFSGLLRSTYFIVRYGSQVSGSEILWIPKPLNNSSNSVLLCSQNIYRVLVFSIVVLCMIFNHSLRQKPCRILSRYQKIVDLEEKWTKIGKGRYLLCCNIKFTRLVKCKHQVHHSSG